MEINAFTARQIVARTMKIIPYSVNVMDERGYIIGSGDPARLQQKHEGAKLAITEQRMVEIDHATAANLKGVKPGINLPIIYLDKVIGVIGVSGEPSQVRQYAELVKMTAELIVEQADLMSQVQWNKRHREELVLQLIDPAPINLDQTYSVAQRLQIDLEKPRVATIFKVIPDQNTAFSLEHLQQLVQLLEYPERDNLVGILSVSNNEVVVLKPISVSANGWLRESENKRIDQLLKRINKLGKFTINMVLGEYFPGPRGLAQSFETARLTMDALGNNKGGVFYYQDHKLPVIMSTILAEPWKAQQLRQPYDLLCQHDPKQTLLKTLVAFFEYNCDFTHTCEKLHIHRNTLRYRIDKVESITSLDINKISDKLHLYLAVRLFFSN
ncbi:sugar diacid recognition domain-containing protein [Motilimonas sp. KMU-193]|uniref:sugar diacid recognition domain-containing protein n=1 Tax=Motilimonas sp. KMU-193 TaxID=3388668 RepID=UPI00396B14C5